MNPRGVWVSRSALQGPMPSEAHTQEDAGNYILLLGNAPSPRELVTEAQLLRNVPFRTSPGRFS